MIARGAEGDSETSLSAIADRKTLKAWLESQDVEIARTIAARVALRALPLVGRILAVPAKRLTLRQKRDLILYSFRTSFISWAARKYPGQEMNAAAARSAAARSSAPARSTVADVDPAGSAVATRSADAAGAAADAAFAAACAATADAYAYASAAAAYATEAYAATVWTSLEADRCWLEENPGGQLLNQPLWLPSKAQERAEPPKWMLDALYNLGETDLVQRGPWGVWLVWYRALLPAPHGGPVRSHFGERTDITIATQPSKFWERDPDEVVAEIAAMADWKWQPPSAEGVIAEDASKKLKNAGETLAGAAEEFSEKAERIIAGQRRSESPPPRRRLAEVEDSRSFTAKVGEVAGPTEKLGNLPVEDTPPTPVLLSPSPPEPVRTHSDEPTARDRLGRRPFAQALAERMDEVVKLEGHDGFAVHLHAPWGAGKTSVLLMMEELMTFPKRAKGEGWAVVHFNAWTNQRRRPPWWPLIQQTYKRCRQCLWQDGRYGRWALIRLRWWAWRIRADWFPYLVAALVIAVMIYLLAFSGEEQSMLDRMSKTLDGVFGSFLKFITVLATAFATFVATGRALVFGSADNAKFYSDLSADPARRITRLFSSVIKTTGKPVAIFIDDLDRCDSDYLVDLLEGVQTLFRGKRVAYVVAADRAWIKAAFEKRYDTFKGDVGEPGQPLGYLFLEKIFQISTPVPGIGAAIRQSYWKELAQGEMQKQDVAKRVGKLGRLQRFLADAMEALKTIWRGEPEDDEKKAQAAFDQVVAAERRVLQDTFGDNLTSRGVKSFVEERGDRPEVRAAAALEMNVSPAAQKEAEHMLARYRDIAGEVPRVMKRMINAFAMRRATGILEGSTIPQDALVRWTIIEQRWPALADLLAERPDRLEKLAIELAETDLEKLEPGLKPFANLAPLRAVIGEPDGDRLTQADTAAITHGASGVSHQATAAPAKVGMTLASVGAEPENAAAAKLTNARRVKVSKTKAAKSPTKRSTSSRTRKGSTRTTRPTK